MTEDKEPPAEESPLKSEVTIEYSVDSVSVVTHFISSTPPAFKAQPPAGDVPPQLAPFERPAWLPVVKEGDGGGVADSKFAGTPWLGASEGWPVCPNCEKPLQFFLQLDLARLPAAVAGEYGTGLLQLFYCTNDETLCETECEAWTPFAKSMVVRLVAPTRGATRTAAVEVEDPFPPKRIVGWREVDDYPSWQEGETLGVELDTAAWDAMWESGSLRTGDKLAGWPYWVQDVEYPDCPECGRKMRLVFQLGSNDNLPYDFGDVGTGHITQCPEHKHVLAFGWACT